MSSDNIASLIYLVLLGGVLGGYFLLANRSRLGQMGRHAALWVLIFVGVVAAVGLWDDIRRTVPETQAILTESGAIAIPQSRDGHYRVALDLNGTPVSFIVDTGATEMVLSTEDATRIGMDPASLNFTGRANTANGVIRTAPIWLEEVRFGEIVDRNVAARVSGGEMPGSLLGMGYLSRFSTIQISNGVMTLVR